MLQKFLKVHKLSPFCSHPNSKPTSPVACQRSASPVACQRSAQDASLALKIVRPGGITECYYMPVQACRILEKYPTYVLAKPEVFRQPWNSVVRPEKILFPGQRFFLVPRHTIRKLRRRNKRPNKSPSSVSINRQVPTNSNNNNNDEDLPSNDSASLQSGEDTSISSEVSSSFSSSFTKKPTSVKKNVRFAGFDVHYKAGEEKPRKSVSSRSRSGKTKGRKNAVPWQPSLTSISEIQGDL